MVDYTRRVCIALVLALVIGFLFIGAQTLQNQDQTFLFNMKNDSSKASETASFFL
ncbi:hypothetical protein [Alkalicoccobacillus gibsonii]|jgi:predicted RND superfamily exporter protein|uniref:hypothetical protein n=1 Tax=Alkalicoccobacillus gibsonii TaxID=79881 RepID=UPI0019333117|nr:hypothetical protein [Alkalicoccobacillus gibsonii]MBM0064595.1 hypothetical protein [Alkalicoccobacillus gibsonii]